MGHPEKEQNTGQHFQTVFNSDISPTRKRYLCIGLISLSTSNNDQALLEQWLPLAVDELGLKAVEEIILQTLLFAGFPKTIEALTTLRKKYAKGPARSSNGNNSTKGLVLSSQVYGPYHSRLLELMDNLHPDLTRWMIEDGYGRILSRPGLELLERELAVLVSLMASGMSSQFRAHFRGALYAGVIEVDIIWFTNTFNCIIAVDGREIFQQQIQKVLNDEKNYLTSRKRSVGERGS